MLVFQGDGSPMAPPLKDLEYRLRLPKGLANYDKVCFTGYPLNDIVSSVEPMSHEVESGLIMCMIEELNSVFSLDLALNVSLDRMENDIESERDEEDDQIAHRIICIGGSHANRVAAAMADLGIQIVDLSIPTWRICETVVEEYAALLKETLAEDLETRTTVLYFLLDNNAYIVHGPGGIRNLPKRLIDGATHVEGELRTADKPAVRDLLSIAAPLLRAGGKAEKVVVAPLVRYLVARCCTNTTHVTNFCKPDYVKTIGEGIRDINTWTQEVLHSKRVRNVGTILPADLLKSKPGEPSILEIFGQDPVAMTDTGYTHLARGILQSLDSDSLFKNKEPAMPVPVKRPAVDRSQQRQLWVTENDSTAIRHTPTTSGRFNSGRYPRGTRARGGNNTGGRGGNWRGRGQMLWRGRGQRYRPY